MSNETLFYTVHILLLTLVLAGCGASTGNDRPANILQSSSHSAASSAQAHVNSSTWSSSNSSANSSTSSTNIKSTILYNKIHSQALATQTGFAVYLPADYDSSKTYPVLYVMYGYGGNEYSMFNSFMSINRTADQMIAAGTMKPMILVVPDYKNSFAVNSTRAQNPNASGGTIGLYEDYLIKELVPHIDQQFATDKTRAGRFIEGYSMGGFAALYLGFNYPDLFSKIGAHSSALWDYSSSDLFIGQRNWLYTTPELRAQRDPFLLARSQDLRQTDIYLDVGTSDPLYGVNQRFYKHLLNQGVRVEWHSTPGGHDKNYWEANTAEYFGFY
jgi:enterochelin esterase-like enzyme